MKILPEIFVASVSIIHCGGMHSKEEMEHAQRGKCDTGSIISNPEILCLTQREISAGKATHRSCQLCCF